MNEKSIETQVKEFDYLLVINTRLIELNKIKETTQKELNDAQQYIQQKGAELNAVLGAISELELLSKSNTNSINH